MKVSNSIAACILAASALVACTSASALTAAAAGVVGALAAVLAGRLFARRGGEGETVLPFAPEMSTLTFPPVGRHSRGS